MRYSQEAAAHILAHAATVMKGDESDVAKLERLWHTLTALQANLLAITLRNTVGTRVLSGPFKGMQLTPQVMTKIYGPLLVGSYEHELHESFERIIAHPYKRIINVGCAFGYYAVGLALRMPQVTVDAFDIEVGEQKKCREMAELNGVQERVHIGGEFRGEVFASYVPEETMLLVDIEGAELGLLDPERYPALGRMDMVVELHDVYDESISKVISERFAATHEIEIIHNRHSLLDFRPILGHNAAFTYPLDSAIIVWENRGGPTPWAVMRAK